VATPASGMVLPHNEAVANAIHKEGKRKSSSSSSSGVNKKEEDNNHYFNKYCQQVWFCSVLTFQYFVIYSSLIDISCFHTRSGTGSNDHVPLQVLPAASAHTVLTPRKKCGVTKKLRSKRAPVQVDSPASPVANTRSKKKLKLE